MRIGNENDNFNVRGRERERVVVVVMMIPQGGLRVHMSRMSFRLWRFDCSLSVLVSVLFLASDLLVFICLCFFSVVSSMHHIGS